VASSVKSDVVLCISLSVKQPDLPYVELRPHRVHRGSTLQLSTQTRIDDLGLANNLVDQSKLHLTNNSPCFILCELKQPLVHKL
jgi:hypothetical protein